MNRSNAIWLLEHSRKPMSLESVSESADPGSTPKYILTGICAEFDTPNDNNRIYKKEDYLKHLDYLKPQIEQGILLGSPDHDEDYHVSMKCVSHIIRDLWYDEEDNTVKIKIELLPTHYGKDLIELVKAGSPLFISSRATGYRDDDTGIVTIDTIYTYDVVYRPGFANAKLTRLSESKTTTTFVAPRLVESTDAPIPEFDKIRDTLISMLVGGEITDVVGLDTWIAKYKDHYKYPEQGMAMVEYLKKSEDFNSVVSSILPEYPGISLSESVDTFRYKVGDTIEFPDTYANPEVAGNSYIITAIDKSVVTMTNTIDNTSMQYDLVQLSNNESKNSIGVGVKVRVTNKDSEFYNKRGIVTSIDNDVAIVTIDSVDRPLYLSELEVDHTIDMPSIHESLKSTLEDILKSDNSDEDKIVAIQNIESLPTVFHNTLNDRDTVVGKLEYVTKWVNNADNWKDIFDSDSDMSERIKMIIPGEVKSTSGNQYRLCLVDKKFIIVEKGNPDSWDTVADVTTSEIESGVIKLKDDTITIPPHVITTVLSYLPSSTTNEELDIAVADTMTVLELYDELSNNGVDIIDIMDSISTTTDLPIEEVKEILVNNNKISDDDFIITESAIITDPEVSTTSEPTLPKVGDKYSIKIENEVIPVLVQSVDNDMITVTSNHSNPYLRSITMDIAEFNNSITMEEDIMAMNYQNILDSVSRMEESMTLLTGLLKGVLNENKILRSQIQEFINAPKSPTMQLVEGKTYMVKSSTTEVEQGTYVQYRGTDFVTEGGVTVSLDESMVIPTTRDISEAVDPKTIIFNHKFPTLSKCSPTVKSMFECLTPVRQEAILNSITDFSDDSVLSAIESSKDTVDFITALENCPPELIGSWESLSQVEKENIVSLFKLKAPQSVEDIITIWYSLSLTPSYTDSTAISSIGVDSEVLELGYDINDINI